MIYGLNLFLATGLIGILISGFIIGLFANLHLAIGFIVILAGWIITVFIANLHMEIGWIVILLGGLVMGTFTRSLIDSIAKGKK